MQHFNELNYFLTVAETHSFVESGKRLGISASALSHSMKSLESKLNLRLFNRTTRSVSLTDAGKQLYEHIAPLYRSINQEIDALSNFLNTPSGTLRINAPEVAVNHVLYPKLRPLLAQYPKIKLEIISENRWVDIVKQGFDMGVRLGRDVAKEMIAVQISAPIKMALVASPDYLQQQGTPKTLEELDNHHLISTRLTAQNSGEIAWEFKHKGKTINYIPQAHFCTNNNLRKQAALDGLGIAWLTQIDVAKELEQGRLVEVLPKYAITYDPLYLYYPSRRGHSNLFQLVVDALRYG